MFGLGHIWSQERFCGVFSAFVKLFGSLFAVCLQRFGGVFAALLALLEAGLSLTVVLKHRQAAGCKFCGLLTRSDGSKNKSSQAIPPCDT